MAIGFLTRNTQILFKKVNYKLLKRYEDGVWQMENCATGRLTESPEAELLEALRDGELCIVLDDKGGNSSNQKRSLGKAKDVHWNSLTDEQRQTARCRWQYVSKALLGPRSTRNLLVVIGEVKNSVLDFPPPSVATLKKWTHKYISSGRDLAALVAQTAKRGNRTNRMDPLVEQIVDASIEQVYLQLERGTMEEARLHAIPQIAAHNRLLPSDQKQLPIPNIGYFFKRLAIHGKFDICAARYGKSYAQLKFKTVLGHSTGEYPLQRVEIDHTPINLIVIDQDSALPLGRPWLTIALDTNTRCILGYYLSFEPPSYLSVAKCLAHAMLPKGNLKKRFPRLKNDWIFYGVMEILVVDNGQEFHSDALEDGAGQYGVDTQYCPRAKPWYKGKVERFLGTMNRGVAHGHPGTTFASILEREDYDPVTTASITLEALHEIIHIWILDFYHQKVHRSLHDTPANCWKDATHGQPIPLPIDKFILDATFAVPVERTLTAKGIELFNMFYNSPECGMLRARLGIDLPLTVRYSPDDIGHIYITEPDTGRIITVPVLAKYRDYATGLSKWQHKVCRDYAIKHLHGKDDVVSLADAKAKIAAVVEEQIYSKRRTLRKNAARHKNAGKPNSKSTGVPSSISPDSPVISQDQSRYFTSIPPIPGAPEDATNEGSDSVPPEISVPNHRTDNQSMEITYVQRRA
jgi:putative transposase